MLHLDATETADLIPALIDRRQETHGGLDVIVGTLPDGRAATLILDPITAGAILFVSQAATIELPA